MSDAARPPTAAAARATRTLEPQRPVIGSRLCPPSGQACRLCTPSALPGRSTPARPHRARRTAGRRVAHREQRLRKPTKWRMVRGCAVAVRAVARMYQCAEMASPACGSGGAAPMARQPCAQRLLTTRHDTLRLPPVQGLNRADRVAVSTAMLRATGGRAKA